jgi:dTDP-4-dehydrorhamnose reductase
MSEPIRWLVTGASGQLGSELVALLSARGEDLTAAGRAELDVTSDRVAGVLRAWAQSDRARPGRLVVLNAAAWTDVDGAQMNRLDASAVNTDGPARLAAACAQLGAVLVHVSTDYVFPGQPAGAARRPYEVDDPVAPATVYGQTKEAGERAVRAVLERHYIVRTAWLYGAVGDNFVKTVARLQRRRDTLEVVDDQLGSPTWAADLAAGLVALVRSGAPYGTYHCAGGGQASRYELARAVFEELGADPGRIRPCGSDRFPSPAPRPVYSVLSDHSWAAAALPAQPHWRDALRSAFQVDRSSLDTPSE